MVNRSIQQKILKMKKDREKNRIKRPRWMEPQIKAKSRPDFGFLVDGQRNQIAPEDPYWAARFPPHRYSDDELISRYSSKIPGWRENNPYPRADVLKRARELVNTPTELHISILKAPLRRVDMHFNSTKDYVYFVEYDYRQDTIRKSQPFGDVSVAKAAWLGKYVTWLKPVSMAPIP